MKRDQAPRYPLDAIKRGIARGCYAITRSAAQGAAELYLDEDDILNCILGLQESHFFKTMASVRRPGMGQDVYRSRYAGFAVYLKLQVNREGWAVVVSFKQDENP